MSVIIDGGYGLIGNLSKWLLLNDMLSEEDALDYRAELEKNDSERYNQYLEWEKAMNEIDS